MEQIIKDLQACGICFVESRSEFKLDDRFEEVKNDENLFIRLSRGFQLNYYAVLPGSSCFICMPGMAYEQADIIIQKSDLFAALTVGRGKRA